MKLIFIIDKKQDKEMTLWMKYPKKYLLHLDEQYKSSLRYFKLSQRLYQKSWDEINNEFSKYIEKQTGHKWFYSKYKCIISAVNPGISNWGDSNTIARHWKESPYFMRRITAHELILSHYFHIYKKHYSHEKLSDGQVWALAEIAAWSLTSLTPEVKKWWPWNTEYYTNHNYPHVVKLQLKLKNIFLKRKNFDEYIEKGIKLVREYPQMGPEGKHKEAGDIFARGVKK
ncbi:hypothetical protein HOG16_03225 [Candidatus Woesearchaeota archaeon]|nr:hypothetical protein [Candidatus Woesearchaeota archaeon]MBT4322130.1 hypothetical protein [Candidatus Woesearchaeota archaeon]MBT4630966.1 hypothetical protein [Candidatus Woesearchaeota archaeon]